MVPAGWYDDPAGSGRIRWWDGTRWTEDLRDKPATVVQSAPARLVDPDALWEAVGLPITGIGGGRFRLTATYLFFEKGIVSTRGQQIPVHEIYDVDVSQGMTQRSRGVGTVKVHVQRATGIETVLIEDVPNFREGVEAINRAAHAERERRQARANTQTFQHATMQVSTPVPRLAANAGRSPSRETSEDDVFVALERLGKLRDAGVVTDAEFEAKKAELLTRI